MLFAAYIVVGVVAALHLYFLVLEMFFWAKPLGRRVFGLSADYAKSSRILAANQGLYNGFLAAGLVWGLTLGTSGHPVIFFFLGCVIVAGIFGGLLPAGRSFSSKRSPARWRWRSSGSPDGRRAAHS